MAFGRFLCATILTLLLSVLHANAQRDVSGHVVDKETGTAMEKATLQLYLPIGIRERSFRQASRHRSSTVLHLPAGNSPYI